jgi:hypothetical protein
MKSRAYMIALGRKGGRKSSAAKIAASRANFAKARAAAAAKRNPERNTLPPFHQAEQRPPASVCSAPVVTTAAAEPTQQPTTARDEATHPPSPRPAARPIRHPQSPDPPSLKTAFDLRVPEIHQFFNLNCDCRYCTGSRSP